MDSQRDAWAGLEGSDAREKDSLRERVEVLSLQKEAEVREKVAKSLVVEDLQLQVAAPAAEKDETLAENDQTHQQALQQKDRALTETVEGIEGAHREVIALKDQSHQTELQARQTELTLLQQELSPCISPSDDSSLVSLPPAPGAKLIWRECAESPNAMREAKAVVINGIVYVGGGGSDGVDGRCTVCKYHPEEEKWATLPPVPVRLFGVGQVSGQLVLVGGWVVSTNKVTGDVHVFTSESQQWEKSIPAMPTARYVPSVVSHSTVLASCGGGDQRHKGLVTVELYSSEASQWYQCPPLPSPRRWMSSVAIGDTLFLVGGFTGITLDSATKSVFSASLSTLIDRAMHHSTGSACTQQVWTTLKDVPYYHSTAASIGGCLLALGGRDRPGRGQTSASIHTYLPTFSTWHQTGELPLPLSEFTAILLPTNELLIIGGMNKDIKKIKDMYNGSLKV